MKHVVIVHGYKGKPEANWKSWLKAELENEGFVVDVPQMPESEHPIASAWATMLEKTLGEPTEESYLIGHSLGCITILRYLETLQQGQKIGGCILVAGFGRKFKEYNGGHESFFDHELDWPKIREHCDNFIALHSTDDRSVEFSQLGFFKQSLAAKAIGVQGMGHFGSADGVYELPIVRDELLALVQ